MRFIILIFLGTIFFTNFAFCSDDYRVGDTLYVWASNGLNLRKGPGTNFGKIAKINFGDRILINQKSNVTFNITGISQIDSIYSPLNTDPIIFKGNWVKVTTDSGIVGFVIDQYLINLKPIGKSKEFSYRLKLEPISIDTINKRMLENEGGAYESTIKKVYSTNITEFETSGGYSGDVTFIFENYTIEEVMILFSTSLNDYNGFAVHKNWENEIEFTDNEICTFSIKKNNSKIIFLFSCSC